MIISKTPFRISFFGGGTDYPAWYEDNEGAVLSTTIDKYCYITCRYLPPFFEHKHRIVYSKIENVTNIKDIRHPAVRAVLQYLKVKQGLEIHHDGDLPARSGLGSSSSFTVGLLNTIYALQGVRPSKYKLAKEAIHIERDLLREAVGSQDQVAAAYGGFNKITFKRDHEFCVEPLIVRRQRLEQLQNHLVIYFTGLSRIASKIAREQIRLTPSRQQELAEMHGMVDKARDILSNDGELDEFGRLLHETWKLKRSLSRKISNDKIDDIYQAARECGAAGGKLLGAGGGGFMLFYIKPRLKNKLKAKLKGLLEVKFSFEREGSQVIFCHDQGMK